LPGAFNLKIDVKPKKCSLSLILSGIHHEMASRRMRSFRPSAAPFRNLPIPRTAGKDEIPVFCCAETRMTVWGQARAVVRWSG